MDFRIILLTTTCLTQANCNIQMNSPSRCINLMHKLTCLVNDKLSSVKGELQVLQTQNENQENNDVRNSNDHEELRNQLQELNDRITRLEDDVQVMEYMDQITMRLDNLEALYSQQRNHTIDVNRNVSRLLPKDCHEIRLQGKPFSGVYTIYAGKVKQPIRVYCDMSANDWGWTVIQRRQDGSVNFTRNWQAYKRGFGLLSREFWLGNDNIVSITGQENRNYTLLITLMDFSGNKRSAEYKNFHVGREMEGYPLNVEFVGGNAGDALTFHNGQKFSTYDVDNDSDLFGNCAQFWYSGGFWFNDCFSTCLHCPYSKVANITYGRGIVWSPWLQMHTSLKATEMKIRPSGF